jgi:hypothetical protein
MPDVKGWHPDQLMMRPPRGDEGEATARTAEDGRVRSELRRLTRHVEEQATIMRTRAKG